MAGRRTNLTLLGLLSAALLTGALAFAAGSGWNEWITVAHGAAGLGIVLLTPWKSVIVRRGVRRERPGTRSSLVFAALIAIALLSGIGHATGLLRTQGGITAMQVHVATALASIPFAVWHALARRVPLRRTDLSRRNLLRSAAVAGGSLAAYGGLAGVVGLTGLPGSSRRFTGSYEAGSGDPDRMPVTQWLNDRVPVVPAESWRLAIRTHGRPAGSWSLAELDDRREPVRAVIDCTGGWYSAQEWEGVRLDRLLSPVGRGRSIVAASLTGYARRYPFAEASSLWLATRAGGRMLSSGHGAPARIVAPNRRGFWWVKWVDSLELSDTPWWWQPPFPLT